MSAAARSLSEIDADIARHEAAIRRLRSERQRLTLDRNAPVVADFDAGRSIAEISEARGLGYSIVQGILYRAGRTEKGRAAVRAALRAVA